MRLLTLPHALLMALVLAMAVMATDSGAGSSQWRLSPYCPAGFALDEDKRCRLRSLYRSYSSLQNAGVGGLQTGLPPVRDGFTAQQIDLGRLLFF
ncbi:MAG: cytochrome-c peroxidase, partial [Gammaproteobacteria bacterium]|nr:cytochrome-c peroxidase [Gammaproteobacteria bacterium]